MHNTNDILANTKCHSNQGLVNHYCSTVQGTYRAYTPQLMTAAAICFSNVFDLNWHHCTHVLSFLLTLWTFSFEVKAIIIILHWWLVWGWLVRQLCPSWTSVTFGLPECGISFTSPVILCTVSSLLTLDWVVSIINSAANWAWPHPHVPNVTMCHVFPSDNLGIVKQHETSVLQPYVYNATNLSYSDAHTKQHYS